MTRCNACGQPIGDAENPHVFDDRTRYHEKCCVQCTPGARPTETQMVAAAKRGHRRGTPRSWAMRGVGG